MRSLKRYFHFTLNGRDPEQAAVIQLLERSKNRADLIKRALFAFVEQGNQPPTVTEQERGQLLLQIQSLSQQLELAQRNQATPAGDVDAPGVSTETDRLPTQVQPGGELSEVFLNGIRKIAKPGLRLDI